MRKWTQSKLNKIKEFIHHHLFVLQTTPHQLALGMAIGIFVGFLPIMGAQTAVSVPIAMLFRASKITAAIGVWISNPVTFIPFYYFNFEAGKWILGMHNIKFTLNSHITFWQLLHLGKEILYPLWVGCIVLGALAAPLTYVITYFVIVLYKNKHEKQYQNQK
jgi:uncharacterized protein (DUF2062 family)